MIDLTNYEDYLLRRVDGELNSAELRELDAFLEHHPSLKTESKWLEAIRLDPGETIVFPDKTSLYRHRAVKPWWSGSARTRWVAAAAAVVLLIGGFLWVSRHPQPQAGSGVPAYAQRSAPVQSIHPAGGASAQQTFDSITARTRTPRENNPPEPSRPSPAPASPPARATDVAAGRPRVKPVADAPRSGVKERATQPSAPPEPGVSPLTPIALAEAPAKAPAGVAAGEVAGEVAIPATPGAGAPRTYDSADAGLPASAALASTAEKLENGKRELDQSITRGLSDLQQKKAALIGQLEKKEIRIGRFTFALNQ